MKLSNHARSLRSVLAGLPAGLLLAALSAGQATAEPSQLSGYEVTAPPGAKTGKVTPFQPCKFTGLPSRGTDAAQCATLVVAENPAKPKGRLIALPVVKLPALVAAKREPIFFLQGGPGGSNLTYGVNARGLFDSHDIYMVGYRGVDDPTPLNCPEVQAALAAPHPLSDETGAQLTEASRKCAARITASGIDLSHYTMLDVIRDHETARGALGLGRVNLISESYGTRVAQYYARVHPRSIRRSVQFAVNPPGHFRWFPEAFNEVLHKYAELCAADRSCSQRTPDLYKSVVGTLARNDVTYNGAPVDMDQARLGTAFLLASTSDVQMAFDALIAAEKGDNSALAGASRLVADLLPNISVWGDLLSKGGGEAPLTDEQAFKEARRSTPTSFGSPQDLLYLSLGRGWPRHPLPPEFAKPAQDKTPTLLINGDLDTPTPARFARDELLPHLPNGRLVILQHQSHEDWKTEQLPALDRLLTGFLADGTVDPSGYVVSPVRFH